MAFAPSLPPSTFPSDNFNCNNSGDRIEAFVLLAVLAMFFLHILGSLRRQSSHSLLHGIVTGINALSYPLVSYTLGLMKSSYCYYNDYAVWAVFLVLLLGSTDNLTAFRLDDIDNWKNLVVKHLFKGFVMVYVIVTADSSYIVYLLPPLLAILLVGILKWYMRIASMRMVSKSYLCKNVKLIADYMEKEHEEDDRLVAFNPVTMEGYRYVVAGERYIKHRSPSSSKVITVEMIWQCTGNLLLRERGNKLKDLCLSMALSKMLNRRFAGFKLSEAELEKTHNFVFSGLLAGEKPHQRAFMVIEEELVFVHDSYYTRYSYFNKKGQYLALFFPVIMIGLCLWLALLSLLDDKRCDHNPNEELNAFCDDAIKYTTIFIIVVWAFLEAYQLYLYIASGWFKVALIWSYVSTHFLQRNGCYLETIIGLLLRLKAFPAWKNKLGQYCILRDLGHKSKARNFFHYPTLRLVDKKKAKKLWGNSVKLSENLKKAIVDSLLRSNGRLTSGRTSLTENGVYDHLSWACCATTPDRSVTSTILIWHIATTLCKHKLDANLKKEDDFITASTLSQYCMHLLVFAPRLLPDHISVSEPLLDEACKGIPEAGAKTIEERCAALMNGTNDEHHVAKGSLVAQGVRLANDLIQHIQDPMLRWKVLSDFWAEMMLYVSPSDDARAHLETLAKGGEFITHLWALLTHAGVLKRGSTEPRDVV